MKMVEWSKDTFEDKEIQEYLEQKIESLLAGPLKNKGEYAQEKCIKSFCEGLRNLEKIMMYKREIHHDQLTKESIPFLSISKNPGEFIKKKEEINKVLRSEVDRQFRHFIAFL